MSNNSNCPLHSLHFYENVKDFGYHYYIPNNSCAHFEFVSEEIDWRKNL